MLEDAPTMWALPTELVAMVLRNLCQINVKHAKVVSLVAKEFRSISRPYVWSLLVICLNTSARIQCFHHFLTTNRNAKALSYVQVISLESILGVAWTEELTEILLRACPNITSIRIWTSGSEFELVVRFFNVARFNHRTKMYSSVSLQRLGGLPTNSLQNLTHLVVDRVDHVQWFDYLNAVVVAGCLTHFGFPLIAPITEMQLGIPEPSTTRNLIGLPGQLRQILLYFPVYRRDAPNAVRLARWFLELRSVDSRYAMARTIHIETPGHRRGTLRARGYKTLRATRTSLRATRTYGSGHRMKQGNMSTTGLRKFLMLVKCAFAPV
jgi:hypothetical protein